jgi:hypothetical protein
MIIVLDRQIYENFINSMFYNQKFTFGDDQNNLM